MNKIDMIPNWIQIYKELGKLQDATENDSEINNKLLDLMDTVWHKRLTGIERKAINLGY